MLLIAIANGLLREFVFKKYVSELTAHQLSTGTLIIFFAFYIGFVMHRFPPSSATQAILIGFIWLLLTLTDGVVRTVSLKNRWVLFVCSYWLLILP